MTAARGLPTGRIMCGDSARLLKQIPDSTIDMVITSPPYYQQRSYGGGETGGERSVKKYIDAVVEVFLECVRVTKGTGNIVFNMGDKYVDGQVGLIPWRFAIKAMSAARVSLISEITWVKPNPTPRQYKKRPVPSTEPFFHFAKSRKYYYDAKSAEARRAEERLAQRSRARASRRYEKLIRESELSDEEKRNALGELRGVTREVQEGKTADFRMKIRGIHAPAFGGQEGGRQSQLSNKGFTIIRMSGNPHARDVIECPVESLKWNDHPAIYPEDLVALLVARLSPKNAVVLDPYIGSGTTAVAAKKAGRRYIGIDINPGYCDAAQRRVEGIA